MEKEFYLFDLGMPNYVGIETEKDKFVMKISGSNPVRLGKTEVAIGFKDDIRNIYVSSKDELRCVKLRWEYKIPKDSKFLSSVWERSYGDMEWKGMSAGRYMPWYFLASTSERLLGFGVRTGAAAMCYWQADSKGLTLFLDVRCGNTGVRLEGRRLKLADIVCASARQMDSFAVAREFCKVMCDNGVFPDFPVYGSNNWYYAYGESSQEEILKDADYIVSLTKRLTNPPYMVIDDCWQQHHRLNDYNGGPWKKGNAKFPDMKMLASNLMAKGVRPGIWFRPLLNEDVEVRKEWRIEHNYCLDPSHPKVLEYIQRDIERFCSWGYTLIKYDFSTYDLFGKWGFEANVRSNTEERWHFYDGGKTNAEIVQLLYKAIYETAKAHDAVIIGCNTIGHLGASYMHISRTGDDTSGKLWERTRRMGVNTLAFRLPEHGVFYHCDADCIGVFKGIPWDKNVQWARLVAESGTPFFLSIKPDALNEKEKKDLQEILYIASKQEMHRVPFDWEITDCPEEWGEDEEIKAVYDWYEDEGPNIDIEVERFYAPLAIP